MDVILSGALWRSALVYVVARQFRLFLPLISTPVPSARFGILTVGRG
jgi:hypothetical protein